MTSLSQAIYLNGMLYRDHPCFTVFSNYAKIGIRNGFTKFTGPGQMYVYGILDDIRDPRYMCLRNSRVPLSAGNATFLSYKPGPRIEGFQIEMPAENNCIYTYKYNAQDQYGHCMYSGDGKLLCLNKSCKSC